MGALLSLGVLVAVLATLSLALAGSPVQGNTIHQPAAQPSVLDVTQASEDTAHKVGGFYTGVIDDLMTYRDNPDLNRAEQRSAQMTSFAERLSGTFRTIADYYEAKFNDLTKALNK